MHWNPSPRQGLRNGRSKRSHWPIIHSHETKKKNKNNIERNGGHGCGVELGLETGADRIAP